MGERKGQTKYYPPDFDPEKHGNLNRYHGTHALRDRAAKIGQGILIIRFEMPYNVWCLGCNTHIGMGVRYNAEKKKVGNYYTTSIYEFRMQCLHCDNILVIRTDPKNFDYECVEGVRRQEKRWDPTTVGQFEAIDRTSAGSAFGLKLAADSMFKLEHGDKDKAKAKDAAPQMEKLELIQYRLKDDFSANQYLRRSFRSEKKEISEQAKKDADLLQKSSLEISLLPEREEDRKTASLLAQYRTVKSFDEKQQEIRSEIDDRPLFTRTGPIQHYTSPIRPAAAAPVTNNNASSSSSSTAKVVIKPNNSPQRQAERIKASIVKSIKRKKAEQISTILERRSSGNNNNIMIGGLGIKLVKRKRTSTNGKDDANCTTTAPVLPAHRVPDQETGSPSCMSDKPIPVNNCSTDVPSIRNGVGGALVDASYGSDGSDESS